MACRSGRGQAIAEILTGKLSPSGRLPISIERTELTILIGILPCYFQSGQWESARIDYGEGIFTGYRSYDKRGVKASFILSVTD